MKVKISYLNKSKERLCIPTTSKKHLSFDYDAIGIYQNCGMDPIEINKYKRQDLLPLLSDGIREARELEPEWLYIYTLNKKVNKLSDMLKDYRFPILETRKVTLSDVQSQVQNLEAIYKKSSIIKTYKALKKWIESYPEGTFVLTYHD